MEGFTLSLETYCCALIMTDIMVRPKIICIQFCKRELVSGEVHDTSSAFFTAGNHENDSVRATRVLDVCPLLTGIRVWHVYYRLNDVRVTK